MDRFESFIKGRPHLSRRAQLCSTVKVGQIKICQKTKIKKCIYKSENRISNITQHMYKVTRDYRESQSI